MGLLKQLCRRRLWLKRSPLPIITVTLIIYLRLREGKVIGKVTSSVTSSEVSIHSHKPTKRTPVRDVIQDGVRQIMHEHEDDFRRPVNLSLLRIDAVMAKAPESAEVEKDEMPLCPIVPHGLVGRVVVDFHNKSWSQLERAHQELLPGGRWRPGHCRARHRVAIIIPYRDRDRQLRLFLQHMHPFLQKQLLEYGIYVVDEALPTKFNRAILMNIGFEQANRLHHYDCTIFHDVDLYPEDDRNLYSCPDQPRHMSVAIDKFAYRLQYRSLFGGIVAMRNEHFRRINGFSNMYFGWGGEDDDIKRRVALNGFEVVRYPSNIARYKMYKHRQEVLNKISPQKHRFLFNWRQRWRYDGLNSMTYDVTTLEERQLCTWIHVNVSETQVLATKTTIPEAIGRVQIQQLAEADVPIVVGGKATVVIAAGTDEGLLHHAVGQMDNVFYLWSSENWIQQNTSVEDWRRIRTCDLDVDLLMRNNVHLPLAEMDLCATDHVNSTCKDLTWMTCQSDFLTSCSEFYFCAQSMQRYNVTPAHVISMAAGNKVEVDRMWNSCRVEARTAIEATVQTLKARCNAADVLVVEWHARDLRLTDVKTLMGSDENVHVVFIQLSKEALLERVAFGNMKHLDDMCGRYKQDIATYGDIEDTFKPHRRMRAKLHHLRTNFESGFSKMKAFISRNASWLTEVDDSKPEVTPSVSQMFPLACTELISIL